MKDKTEKLADIIFPLAQSLTYADCIEISKKIIRQGWNDITNLIGSIIYTYEIDKNEFYIYEDKIFAVGKDFVYVNDDTQKEECKIHYFKDFGTLWFLDRNECQATAIKEKNTIY